MENRQLVSDLVIKGFAPLAMVAAAGYFGYLILDRQMDLTDRLFDQMLKAQLDVATNVEEALAMQKAFQAEMRAFIQRDKAALQNQSTPLQE